jgi:hypothetical protein
MASMPAQSNPATPSVEDDAADHRRRKALRRQSAIAGGIATIAVLFILETLMASRLHPHPATPYIRLGLGTVALVALVTALVLRIKAGRRQG